MAAPAIAAAAEVASISAALRDRIEETAKRDGLKPGEVGLALRAEGESVVFYLIASDSRTAREVESLARAFVWPSFARARQPQSHLKRGDPFAEEVARLAQEAEPVVLLAPPDYVERCSTALERLLEVQARRPDAAVLTPRRLAVVLRDFEDAVAREDVAAARTLMQEAWNTGRLTLINRSYLEVRALACAREWVQVVAFAERHRLPDLLLPAPVEHDVIRGAFNGYLADPLHKGLDVAVQTYRTDIAPRVGGAFRDHRVATSREARLGWMIHYAALPTGAPRAATAEILEGASDSVVAELRALAAALPKVDGSSEQTVRALVSDGEDAAAFAVAAATTEMEPSVRADVLDVTANRLDDPIRREAVIGEAEVIGINTWHAWLTTLFETPDWPDAYTILESGYERWDAEFEDGHATGDELAPLVEALAGETEFRRALPRLVRAVMPSGQHEMRLIRVRENILKALAYATASEPTPGLADLEALIDLASALLRGGIGEGDFRLLLGQMEATFDKIGAAPVVARYVVDVIRVLLTLPVPSNADRDQSLAVFLRPLVSDAQRARPLIKPEVWVELLELIEQREDLLSLFRDVDGAGTTDQDVDDSLDPLNGRKVLLHTLVSSAAERAKAYLESVVRDITVWTDSSEVATDALRQRARRADYVVVASRATKHAAFDCIQASRDSIGYASGKGWSSLVTGLRDAAGLS
jgi:hypothetical protein